MIRSVCQKVLVVLMVSLTAFIVNAQVYTQDNPFVLQANQPTNNPATKWLTLVYKDLFARLEIPLEIIYFPELRASVDDNVDGQFSRALKYGDIYPHQLIVEFPLLRIKIIAVTKYDSEKYLHHGWESFKEKEFRIDYMRGVEVVEKNLQKWADPKYVEAVSSVEQGLLKLKHGRTDFFIHPNLALFSFLKSKEFRNDIAGAGVLVTIYAYPYVNIKHKEMVPAILKTLNEMKAEGKIRQYCYETFGEHAIELCEEVLPAG
ncbi:transporter substrate-binding domain-containing protein [Vibrio kyushuensis]|uniref:hypothetical protein n=1 Tax=Vibrio kyushuensis TaxID=2910249 RepID=UPI003D13D90A